jgi:malate/lactate dehydrogenase
VHGIGLTVSGLIHATLHEIGALIPVSVRVADAVCASLPCVLGPDGPSAPIVPTMTGREERDWEHSLAVLTEANQALPA